MSNLNVEGASYFPWLLPPESLLKLNNTIATKYYWILRRIWTSSYLRKLRYSRNLRISIDCLPFKILEYCELDLQLVHTKFCVSYELPWLVSYIFMKSVFMKIFWVWPLVLFTILKIFLFLYLYVQTSNFLVKIILINWIRSKPL